MHDSAPRAPLSGSIGAPARYPDDIPERDDDPEEHHHQQTPGRRSGEVVNDPSDQRTPPDTPDKLREDPATEAIVRIGMAAPRNPITLLFALFGGLEPL